MRRVFNTDMPFHERRLMASKEICDCLHEAERTDAAGNGSASQAEPLPGASSSRNARVRRPRFDMTPPEDATSGQGGAIAVSFAVVSRKRWPL